MKRDRQRQRETIESIVADVAREISRDYLGSEHVLLLVDDDVPRGLIGRERQEHVGLALALGRVEWQIYGLHLNERVSAIISSVPRRSSACFSIDYTAY